MSKRQYKRTFSAYEESNAHSIGSNIVATNVLSINTDSSIPNLEHIFKINDGATEDSTAIPRSGKWSPDEEMLANRLIVEFDEGSLTDCEQGCTLRSYLARKLNCAPMRISKKFAGRCIGKRMFTKKAFSESGIKRDKNQLSSLSIEAEDPFNLMDKYSSDVCISKYFSNTLSLNSSTECLHASRENCTGATSVTSFASSNMSESCATAEYFDPTAKTNPPFMMQTDNFSHGTTSIPFAQYDSVSNMLDSNLFVMDNLCDAENSSLEIEDWGAVLSSLYPNGEHDHYTLPIFGYNGDLFDDLAQNTIAKNMSFPSLLI